jgi:hypothetical protein
VIDAGRRRSPTLFPLPPPGPRLRAPECKLDGAGLGRGVLSFMENRLGAKQKATPLPTASRSASPSRGEANAN